MEAAIIWIALIIIFAVVEIITVGLTSIWFAGGAVVALLVDAAGLGPVWQFAAFVVVSVILLVFTRPWVTESDAMPKKAEEAEAPKQSEQ